MKKMNTNEHRDRYFVTIIDVSFFHSSKLEETYPHKLINSNRNRNEDFYRKENNNNFK